ncbi:helix-turn-helix domain-containing protein [Ochrobactrum sp. Sa2BUA5]|nr:helix-turn-helix domain-containing protein [Ochrobactrum gallinarum]
MTSTTPRQKQAYDFIRSFIDKEGYGPSYQEISEALGITSRSSIHRLVHGLKERGLIELIPNRARCIALKPDFYAAYHLRRVLSAIDGSPVSDNQAVQEAARYLSEAA